ncbi:MAG: ABC transporter ATP-binding protein, partial [Gammaproteobacteria bacterium]
SFAGYRLLPAFRDIFKNLTQLRFSLPSLDTLYDDLTLMEQQIPITTTSQTLHLQESITLEDVTYRYPGAEAMALSGINLTIPAGKSVGFVGSTGAGKSTAVDIILGLLTPAQGRVLIDGQPLEAHCITAWQRTLGYVPQVIYLTDDTVAANIAFGIPKEQIDQQALVRAARAAHIDEFITRELPYGYDTEIGERGIRLSGGERQRLAIARALYHDPDVVVFDEATSALDNVTEKVVMEAIKDLHGSKTVILIAHRLPTVRNCDRIFLLEQGRLVGEGSYDELAGSNAGFQRFTRATGV